LIKSRYVEAVQDIVRVMAAYCDTMCSHNTDVLYELYVSTLNQVCNFSEVLALAPWWWFPCKPKHVGI